jgi:hypothetical protein
MRQNRVPFKAIKSLNAPLVQAVEMFQSFEKGAVRREGRKIKDESGKRKVKDRKSGATVYLIVFRARPWNRLRRFHVLRILKTSKTSQVEMGEIHSGVVTPTKRPLHSERRRICAVELPD